MALKFEIIGNNLVVTDTADGSVKLERPAADIYAICEATQWKLVTRTDRSDVLLTNNYNGLVDTANTAFSKDTFTNFCRHSLGALKQGGFTFIDPSLVPVLSGPQVAHPKLAGIAALTNRGSLIDEYGSLIDKNGIFIASETWDLGWRAKLENSFLSRAEAAFCGDSNTQGWWASDLDNKTFVGLVRQALQAKYGNGGSGYKGSAYSAVSALAGNVNFMATVAASSFFALTGTWAQNTSILDGPGTNLITASSVGATANYTVYGDTVNVYFATGNTATFGQYEVSIDGGAFTAPVSTNTGVEAIATRIFAGLSKGNHSVSVRATDANGTIQFFFCGVEGLCSTGVAVHNYGRGGFPSLAISNLTGAAQQFTTTSGQVFATSSSNGSRGKGGQWSGGSKKPADLICVAYGINDARFTTPVISAQSYMDNIRRYIEDVREGTSADGTTGNPNASIILMLCPRWAAAAYSDSGKSAFIQYGQQLLTLAREFDCAFLNTWAIQRNSYNYALSNGWVGNANNAGASGSDQLHGSDAWHQKVADALIPRII